MALSYAFGGDTGETADSIKRKRERARALLEQALHGTPRNAGEGLTALGAAIGGRFAENRANKAETAGRNKATEAFNAFLPGWTGGDTAFPAAPSSGGRAGADVSAATDYPSQRVGAAFANQSEGLPSVNDMTAYIGQAAQARGIDPDTAIRVARSEGLAPGVWQSNVVKDGRREPSYGPFQLYKGGGLGNQFMEKTGLDPSEPANWKATVDFALDQAQQGGWSPWYGSKAAGIGPWQGINRGQPSQPVQVASNNPAAGVAQATEPRTAGVGEPMAQGGAANRVLGTMLQGNSLTGGQPMGMEGGQTPQNAPQQPAQRDIGLTMGAPVYQGENASQGALGGLGGLDPRMIQLANNPFLPEGQRAVLQAVIQQQLQQSDPMRRLQMQKLQQEITTAGQGDPFTLSEGQTRYDAQGNVVAQGAQEQPDLPNSVEEYNYYVQQERDAGRQPLSYNDWNLQSKRAGASNVSVDTGGDFSKQLQKNTADAVLEERGLAKDAADVIRITNEGRQLLDRGAITGAGAGIKTSAIKWAGSLGVPVPQDAADNSQAFKAVMGKAVGKIIKQFGAGTGLSDADRQYAERIVGGDVELNEAAIRRIFDLADKGARAKIKAWQEKVPKVLEGDMGSMLGVDMPPEYTQPTQGGSPAADDPLGIR